MYPQLSHTEVIDQSTSLFLHSVKSCELHRHQATEILWVLSGSIKVHFDQSEHILEAGALLVINANQHHAVSGTSSDNLVLCLQHRFSTQFTSDLTPESLNPVNTERLNDLRTRLAQLWWEQRHQGAHWEMAMDANLLSIQLLLKRYFPGNEEQQAPAAAHDATDQVRVHRIIQYLEQYHQNPISLSHIAEQFGLTESYLSHYFRVHTGTTLLRYLTRLRLEKALYELSQTATPVSELALSVGFPSIKAFNSAFKREYQTTPTEFRQRQSDENSATAGRHYAPIDTDRAEQKLWPWLAKSELYL